MLGTPIAKYMEIYRFSRNHARHMIYTVKSVSPTVCNTGEILITHLELRAVFIHGQNKNSMKKKYLRAFWICCKRIVKNYSYSSLLTEPEGDCLLRLMSRLLQGAAAVFNYKNSTT